jgi:hypothetical protein
VNPVDIIGQNTKGAEGNIHHSFANRILYLIISIDTHMIQNNGAISNSIINLFLVYPNIP